MFSNIVIVYLQVSEVRLFGEEDVTQDLFITFCQWQDDSSKVMVLGQRYYQIRLNLVVSKSKGPLIVEYEFIQKYPKSANFFRPISTQFLQNAQWKSIKKCPFFILEKELKGVHFLKFHVFGRYIEFLFSSQDPKGLCELLLSLGACRQLSGIFLQSSIINFLKNLFLWNHLINLNHSWARLS